MKTSTCILGGGMTGLAAGLSSRLPVYEKMDYPGGICSSYYVRPGDSFRLRSAPKDGGAYRFEIGGGHWIFGNDALAKRTIRSMTPVRTYVRKSAVYLPKLELFVPYPIQNHLRCLGADLAKKALSEMVEQSKLDKPSKTMAEWITRHFGKTLGELFFEPFHELYTAGLYKRIAPQDAFKSPLDLQSVIQGTVSSVPPLGYNVEFAYPEEGLDALARNMAGRCDIHYGKRVIGIDVKGKTVSFEDGSAVGYDALLSTLPLNQMIRMTNLTVDEEPDPAVSVLVVNIGAVKGPGFPDYHWVYIPESTAGFHRVGFYSNVDESFLPASARKARRNASIYVEKAYLEGRKPPEKEIDDLCRRIVGELKDWKWIEEAEVVDPTWIEVAYTWSWPGSKWKEGALEALREHDVYQVGRFAQWAFQGISDSIRDGLTAGGAAKGWGK